VPLTFIYQGYPRKISIQLPSYLPTVGQNQSYGGGRMEEHCRVTGPKRVNLSRSEERVLLMK
jgi:hypothetical protein